MLKKASRLILSMIMSFGVISTPVYAEEETAVPEEETEEIQTQEETEEENAEQMDPLEYDTEEMVNVISEGYTAVRADLCVYKNTIKQFVDNYKIAQIQDYGDEEASLENGISNITYFDLDKNGMPELFITVDENTSVYTYINGSVKLLNKAETYWAFGSQYLKFVKDSKNTLYYCCYVNDKYCYYKLSGGSFILAASGVIGEEGQDEDNYEYYQMISVNGSMDIDSSEEELETLNNQLIDCRKNCKVFLQLFNDVRDSSKYFYDAVYWAYDNGITTGTTANIFEPDTICTRGHIVTFLWRLAGKPVCSDVLLKFKDVKKGAWYEDAVKWAVKNNITTGTTPTSFEPAARCTRGHIVTFLYRYWKKITGQTPNYSSVRLPFKDVKKGAWYEDAVKWAYSTGVTTGKNKTSFDPAGGCTRGQGVLFLKRTADLKN